MALERETEIILRSIQERTIGGRDAIRIDALLRSDVPAGVKAYVAAEITHELERDAAAGPYFGQLDAQDAAVRRLLTSSLRSLAAYHVCARDEFLALLDNAVHFLQNYICRPRWTLESYVFAMNDSISTRELQDRLRTFVEYRYLPSLVGRLVARKGLTEITRSQLHEFVKRADNEVVRRHNARELALLARPLFEFFAADAPDTKAIPLQPLLLFYEDKELTVLKDYIGSICRIRGRDTLTLQDLTILVEDLYTEKRPVPPSAAVAADEQSPTEVPEPLDPGTPEPAFSFAPAPEPPVLPPHVQAEDMVEEPAPALSPPALPPEQIEAPAEEASPEPLPPLTSPRGAEIPEEEVPVELSLPEEIHGEAEPPPPQESPTIDFARKNIALSLTFAGLPPARHLPDLKMLITGDQRARFIKRVFKKDEDYYAGVIATLNDMENWKEASLYLNDLFQLNDLDPFSADVVEFTDAVHQRFIIPG